MSPRPLKIVFSMRHSGALRNFSSTVEELARRGHRIHLIFMRRDKLGESRLLDELAAGRVDPALVDRSVRRVLTQKVELGLLDPDWTPESTAAAVELDSAGNRDIARRLAEGVYRYRARSSSSDLLKGAVQRFVERNLDGSVSPLLAYLSEGGNVSESELRELEALVARLNANRKQER